MAAAETEKVALQTKVDEAEAKVQAVSNEVRPAHSN